MLLFASRLDLLSLISKVTAIVPSKTATANLGTVLLEATNDELIMTATDLSVTIRSHIGAKVIKEGAIALPARRLSQLIRELAVSEVQIESTSQEVATIVAGGSKFKIHGLAKAEFPIVSMTPLPDPIEIDAKRLKEMFQKTSFCTLREEGRYMLNGVLSRLSETAVTFLATDGKRLAKVEGVLLRGNGKKGSFVIPIKGVEEISKLLSDETSPVLLSFFQDKLIVELSRTTLVTKLLSGQYPDVEKVIPQSAKLTFRLHREELISLLRQVALFTTDDNCSATFSFGPGELQLTAATSSIGEGRVSMPLDYEGEPIEIAFNPFFFSEILRHSQEEVISFSLNDPYNPGLMTDPSGALFVLMPMRLKEAVSEEAGAIR